MMEKACRLGDCNRYRDLNIDVGGIFSFPAITAAMESRATQNFWMVASADWLNQFRAIKGRHEAKRG